MTSQECELRLFLQAHRSSDSCDVTSLAGGKYNVSSHKIHYITALSKHTKDYWIQEIANPHFCKLFFDIDNKKDEEYDWITNEIIENIKAELFDIIKHLYGTRAETEFVFNDKFPKQKCHVYVVNVVNTKKEREFINEELKIRIPILRERLDNAKGLRVIGAYKVKTPKLDENGYRIGPIICDKNKGRYIPNERITRETYEKYSLITFPKVSKSGLVINKLSSKYTSMIYGEEHEHEEINIDEVEYSELSKHILNHPSIKGIFTLGDPFGQNGINLNRIKPAYCSICDRIHDNDRAYVTYTLYSYKIYCRRQENKNKVIYVEYGDRIEKTFDITPHLLGPNEKLRLRMNKIVVHKNKFRESDQWVQPFTNEKSQVIHAGMFKGKSYQSNQRVNSLPENERILVITPRQSFARSITNELNRGKRKFHCYLDEKNIREYNSVVIQVESLHKIEGEKFDHIIIDECESIFTQLTSIETQEEHYKTNHEVFLYLLYNNKSIIFMDAFVSNKTLDFLNACNIKYTYYDYSVLKPQKRTYKHYRYISKKKNQFDMFLTSLITDLTKKKKIYMFCSSIKKLHEIVSLAAKG